MFVIIFSTYGSPGLRMQIDLSIKKRSYLCCEVLICSDHFLELIVLLPQHGHLLVVSVLQSPDRPPVHLLLCNDSLGVPLIRLLL